MPKERSAAMFEVMLAMNATMVVVEVSSMARPTLLMEV